MVLQVKFLDGFSQKAGKSTTVSNGREDTALKMFLIMIEVTDWYFY